MSYLTVVYVIIGLLVLLSIWHFYCRVSFPKISLNGANVLITGGSEGIGFSVAKSMILKGANVAILARNKQKLSNAAEKLTKLKKNSSQKVVTISCDVSDYDQMKKEIISSFNENKWNELDVLISNAGVELVATFENTSIKDYHRIMNINYFGTVNIIKILLPYLKKNKNGNKYGRILINCSLLGVMSMSYYSAYCASKWALRGYVQSIFAELTAYNIYTSIVYPPDVQTEQLKREKSSSNNIPKTVADLSSAADVFEPDVVGNDIMLMIQNGQYKRSWGVDGWMLLNLTTGFSISSSLIDTITEILFLGVFRMIGMWYIQNIYHVCKNSMKK